MINLVYTFLPSNARSRPEKAGKKKAHAHKGLNLNGVITCSTGFTGLRSSRFLVQTSVRTSVGPMFDSTRPVCVCSEATRHSKNLLQEVRSKKNTQSPITWTCDMRPDARTDTLQASEEKGVS